MLEEARKGPVSRGRHRAERRAFVRVLAHAQSTRDERCELEASTCEGGLEPQNEQGPHLVCDGDAALHGHELSDERVWVVRLSPGALREIGCRGLRPR